MLPHHVAIIMDGNGRWAKKRMLPRTAGHLAGVKAVRCAIDFCLENDIKILSLYTLSVENFTSRPKMEVKFLISLFSELLAKNLDEMHSKGIQLRIIGNLSVFSDAVQTQLQHVQTVTQHNTKLTVVLAVNYSGRWDIFQAAQKTAQYAIDHRINPTALAEENFSSFLSLQDVPEPDILIRTGGDQRISNFMLWQFAYTELFFVNEFWPDFDGVIFDSIMTAFSKRERRFGKVVS